MMAPTAATMLRSSFAARPSTTLIATAKCPYSTFTTSSVGLRCSTFISEKSSASILRSTTKTSPITIYRRAASTDAQQDARAAASAAASAAQQATQNKLPSLDWNTFFKLRKSRRRWQLTFSIVTAAAGGTVGAVFLSTGAADVVTTQVPLDPFVTLGAMTFGFAALGWLAGPSLGNFMFYTLNRQFRPQMLLKESQFFARIKKNRVDPSNSSAGNPVPDFYGEKISSVSGYRRWMKDQRAFNKKRTTFV